MSAETTNHNYQSNVWTDEIDLQRYIDILIRRWRSIIVITALMIAIAISSVVAMRAVLPPRYIANADVAIIRTVSNVNFDERFRTDPESVGENAASLSARRSALLGIVLTGAIAEKVIGKLGDLLSQEEQIPAQLLENIQAEIVTNAASRTDSDLIRIFVTADEPDKSAAIANEWAEAYVEAVNSIYGQVPDSVMNSIEEELAKAENEYQDSQAKLENFIADNQIDRLSAVVTILEQRITQEVSLQQAYLERWQETKERLNLAKTLQKQIEGGGEGAARSNAAALQLLKMSTFGMAPTQLQVELRDLPEIDADAMLLDVQSLISSLETELEALEQSTSVDNSKFLPATSTATALQLALGSLRVNKASLETEQARQRQLAQTRDINWETYRTLSNKVAELSLARAAASSEVRIGPHAVPPSKSIPRVRLLIAISLAAFTGVIIGLFYVAITEYRLHLLSTN